MPIFNSADNDQQAGFVNNTNPNDANKQQQQMQQQQMQQQFTTPDDALAYAQQSKEEAKFEVKKEIVDAVTAKAQQLMDVDPTTATALRAFAAAVNEAVSMVNPIGDNGEFNAQQQQQMPQQQDPSQLEQQPAQKTASDPLKNFIAESSIEKIASTGYFKLNEHIEDALLEKDLQDTIDVISVGVEKFASDNDINFEDSNTWDLLKELIEDGTMFNMGAQELKYL